MSIKKVVCVDDDKFYRDLYTNILERKGFEVIVAANPEEGWGAIQEINPDIVTLDVMMPEIEGIFDGYGLLNRMQKDDSTKKIPVIMISALGDKEDAEHGLEAGAKAYLPKHEMSPDKLVDMLNEILEK